MNKEDLAFMVVLIILAIQFGLFMWSYSSIMDDKAHETVSSTYLLKEK